MSFRKVALVAGVVLAGAGFAAVGMSASAAEVAPAPVAAVAPAKTVLLFDDPFLSDTSATEGIAGPGCKNLRRANVTSSISAVGTYKIWSGKDCTGRSAVVNGDVRNLADINFDNDIESIFFEPAPVQATLAKATPAKAVLLFDDPFLSDTSATQGIAGVGCKNVRPNVASSISAVGTYKIWSGKDCTGRSQLVDGDVLNLADINFDNDIESVFLG
jgi:hypothetical protein